MVVILVGYETIVLSSCFYSKMSAKLFGGDRRIVAGMMEDNNECYALFAIDAGNCYK